MNKYEVYLLSEIKRFVSTHGRVPTSRDFKKGSGYPSIQAYRNHFGLWSTAIRLAGFEPSRTRVENLALPKYIRKVESKNGYLTPTKLKR